MLSPSSTLTTDISPSPSCVDRKYPSGLPATSVVIIFHNEAYTVLLRTITSVVNRTPPELLHEVVLVDDYSDHGEEEEGECLVLSSVQ